MTKGTKVTIRPTMFPMQVWEGEIVRATKYGFKVAYVAFGVRNSQVFSARELALA